LTERRPIFASRDTSQTIGYFDSEGAYDLSGRLRCRYSEVTGNLSDPETGKIVGHLSLEGKFVGLPGWLRAISIADNGFSAGCKLIRPARGSRQKAFRFLLTLILSGRSKWSARR